MIPTKLCCVITLIQGLVVFCAYVISLRCEVLRVTDVRRLTFLKMELCIHMGSQMTPDSGNGYIIVNLCSKVFLFINKLLILSTVLIFDMMLDLIFDMRMKAMHHNKKYMSVIPQ